MNRARCPKASDQREPPTGSASAYWAAGDWATACGAAWATAAVLVPEADCNAESNVGSASSGFAMVSDSTGILPMHATPAGFAQETYGTFRGSLLGTDQTRNQDMIKLWREQPARALAFRFGYPDYAKKDGHLMVTRKQGTQGN